MENIQKTTKTIELESDKNIITKEFGKLHEYLEHPGLDNFYKNIKQSVKNKNITKNMIKEISEFCQLCQQSKIVHKKFGLIKGNLNSFNKFEKISSDITGPFKYDLKMPEKF